jgi:hypothetical protein
VNTAYYRLAGRRLAGRLGDTLIQTEARLRRYYRACGLRVAARYVNRGPLGAPRFVFHDLTKPASVGRH